MKLTRLFLLILILGFVFNCSSQVVINEVCTHNSTLIKDEDNDDPDWIELFNSGASDYSLSGHSLTDDSGMKWYFPDINLATQNYLIVFASAKDRHGSILHTSFKLSKNGETIRFFNSSDIKIDEAVIGNLQIDHSYGRSPNGSSTGWGIFDQPTPGSSNDSTIAYMAYADNPIFSIDAGFYPESKMLSISAGSVSDVVHYTTDGSLPLITSPVYGGPIFIDSSVVLRARAYSMNSSLLPSEIITSSYFINYTSGLPVISISTDPFNLWDWDNGIYVLGPNASPVYPYYGANFWQDWEIPAYIEFFETNKKQIFEQDAGVSINGGSVSRTRPQQSLRLTAREKFGAAEFNYKFFEEKDIDHFKIVILRNSSGDFNKTHFRDGSLHKLMLGHVDIDLLCYRPSAVFLNGQYWGVLNLREKVSKYYLHENYGIDPENIDLLEEDSSLIQGDFTAFNAMHAFVTSSDMTVQANYDSAASVIDIGSFCDYIIAETFLSNIDWPYNNIKYWRLREPGSKWRYLLMDLDISLGNNGWAPAGMDILGRLLGPFGENNKHVQLLKSLLKNYAFRNYFINRYADLVNTLFSVENMRDNTLEVKKTLEAEMPLHFARWGNSMQTWNDEINNVVMPYIESRPGFAMQQIQDTFKLKKQVEVELDVWPPGAGYIKINTIHTHLPWSGTYFDGAPVTITAYPDPGFSFIRWQSEKITLIDPTQSSFTVNVDTNNFFTAFFGTNSDVGQLFVYPNPAMETVNLGFVLDNEETARIYFSDSFGKEVKRIDNKQFVSGFNSIAIPVMDISSGVYILQIITAQSIKSAKVIIIH
jgi:hypothetical protein